MRNFILNWDLMLSAISIILVRLQSFDICVVDEVGLDQTVEFGSVELDGADIEETLETFSLLVALNIKHKLLGSKVGFDVMRHALNRDCRVKAIRRQLHIFKGNTVKGPIFGEEYFSFVKHNSASNHILVAERRSVVFSFVTLIAFAI